MSYIVDRIRAKVTRAKQHIQDFQLALTAFYNTRPYEIGVKVDANTGKRIYYITRVDSIPETLETIAADIIQNLRSPLDQIAHQLVLDARGGTEPEWVVYYPISRTAPDYPGTRGGKIKGVRQEIINAIDATEPYQGGKGHALWQLNELNKPDKHQLLIATGSFSGGVNMLSMAIPHMRQTGVPEKFINMVPDDFKALFIAEKQRRPIQVGDEILIESPPFSPEVQNNPNFAFYVSFNALGIIEPEPAIKTVQDMANLVDDIIVKLGRFLP